MGSTNFPNGVNIAPFSIPIMMPMSKYGKAYFVDPVNGNDGRIGSNIDASLQTLARAYELCVTGRGDVVYLFNDGSTTGTARLTTQLTWSKANTHLVGICAPSALSQRARISHSATAGIGFPTLFKLDAPGCMIQNVQFFQGYAVDEDQICFELSSLATRCYFNNVHFAGIGATLPAARTGSASMKLGGAENVFDGCTIGIDTTPRQAANSEIIVTVGTRNLFRDCLFPTYAGSSGAGHLFVSAAASCLDRWIMFRRCLFINSIQSGATAMTAAMSINGTGSPAGMAILDNCTSYGSTYWTSADTSKVMLIGAPGAANSQLIGLGLVADHP